MRNFQDVYNSSYSLAIPGGVCSLGYTGVLCHKCSNGFSKISNEKCSPCFGIWNFLLMLFKIIFRVLLYFYMVIKGYLLCDSLKRTENKINSKIVISNFLIKILILHSQFLKTLLGFPFKFDSIFEDFFKILFLFD